MIPFLTITEWEVVIAAYAYETGHQPTMSDYTYDVLSSNIKVKGNTSIPKFESYTGSWVMLMDTDTIKLVYETALGVNQRFSDIHHPAIIYALDKLNIEYINDQ